MARLVVLAALGIALIFQPVRHRLQHLIDSRYFATHDAPHPAEVSEEPILKAIASALDHAHARGVIHRDVKPHNILMGRSQDSALLHPYLTDFGIARMIGANTILTQGTSMMGTLDYAAPEQIAGLEDADHRADIYALGTVAYLMFSGRLPFHEAHAGALIFSLLRQPPPDPRTLNADIPTHVALALLRALAKEPDERYDSAGAFVQALA